MKLYSYFSGNKPNPYLSLFMYTFHSHLLPHDKPLQLQQNYSQGEDPRH